MDPPYAPKNNKSFVNYTLEQHKLLFEMCKNYNFVMSNSYVELVKTNFINYDIEIILCKRTINSKTKEVIIKSNRIINPL